MYRTAPTLQLVRHSLMITRGGRDTRYLQAWAGEHDWERISSRTIGGFGVRIMSLSVFGTKNTFHDNSSSWVGIPVPETGVSAHVTVSTMKTSPKTYSSNGMSKKPGGAHAKRPTLLSLNSGIDSPCKGLNLTSAAAQIDQECIVPGSWAEISVVISSTQHFGLTQHDYERKPSLEL